VEDTLGLQSDRVARRQALIEAAIALVAFYILSLLSRLAAPVFLLVVGGGLCFPPIEEATGRRFPLNVGAKYGMMVSRWP